LTSAALIATFFGMNLTRYVDLDDIIPIEYVMLKMLMLLLLVFF
jgi:Mg2+ and Co2+ transporter CorA